VLDLIEEPLDQISSPVKVRAEAERLFPIASWRDIRPGAMLAKLLSRLKSGSMLLADRGYDADWIRTLVRQRS
jgi:hypothetical protein